MAHLDTDLLKPTDVARRLGVSRSWVYDAAASGRIPCVRLGGPDGPLRFLPEDVESGSSKRGATGCPASTRSELRASGADGYRRRRSCNSTDPSMGPDFATPARSAQSNSRR